MKLTYGADFEAFVIDDKANVIPVCGLLGGTKENPKQFEGETEGYMYQEDGVTAEFNVPACDSPAALIGAMTYAIGLGRKLIKKTLGKGYDLWLVSAATFDMRELAKHPQAMRVGCDPDFQCYFEGKERDIPDIKAFGDQRFAGTHIHVGYETWMAPEWMVAMSLDNTLYKHYMGACVDRSRFYPRGIYRPKPYGVEYRGLGSSVLADMTSLARNLTSWHNLAMSNWGDCLEGPMRHMQGRAERLRPIEEEPVMMPLGEVPALDDVVRRWADDLEQEVLR